MGHPVHSNLFSQSLKTRAGEVENVFLDDTLKRSMISIDVEKREPTKVERALKGSPNNGQTFKLDS